MSSNVGLTTPRGSGTSGYIQRNLSLLKPQSYSHNNQTPYTKPPRLTQPSAEILQHNRLRDLEIQILSFRDDLEDQNLPEDEVDERCEEMRKRLTREMEEGKGPKGEGKRKKKRYEVHDLAEEKLLESERLRRALGLGRGEIGGGQEGEGEHPMARQERRKREREESRKEVER